MKDFFISYNKADRSWAEWIAWQLEEARYTVIVQAWDFRPGSNFVLEMQRAAVEAERTIAVLSPDYLAAQFTQPEWAAAFAQDPTGEKGTLLPVRVRECEIKGLLHPIVYIDLFKLEEASAKRALLSGIKRGRAKPDQAPEFPGATSRTILSKPRFPGDMPAIWNVPHLRNPNFTGREEELTELRASLLAGETAALVAAQAIYGLGGVGKTQLAVEYSYRHGADYDVVWWVRSEEPTTLASDYASLAVRLNLREKDEKEQRVIVEAVKEWLRRNRGWLLMFDNAEDVTLVREYIPRGSTGHIVVTSRNPNWTGVAKALSVKPLSIEKAIEFLLKRTGHHDEAIGRILAEALGRLPLALEQAGAYIETSGCTMQHYLELFETRQREMLARGRPSTDYPDTVATTWSISFERLESDNPAAAELLRLCAFFAHDDIPITMLVEGADEMPESLALIAGDALLFDEALMAVRKYSLIEIANGRICIHRLVQAVIRHALDDEVFRQWTGVAVHVVNAYFPLESDDVRQWAICSLLLPHASAALSQAESIQFTSSETARLLNQIGLYLKLRGEYAQAQRMHERGLAIDEAALGPSHPEVATELSNLGVVLKLQGDLIGATNLYLRALAINEAALGPNHPDVACDLSNLALVLESQGYLDRAEEFAERALAIGEATLGPDDPEVANFANTLGEVRKRKGDLVGAKGLYERALVIAEGAFGADHPKVAVCANNLGSVLAAQGDLDTAKALFERALAIDEAALGPNHPKVATRLNNLAWVLKEQADVLGAKTLYERALAISETALGPHHPQVAICANNLGIVFVTQGNLGGAKALYERALAINELTLGPNHPSVAIQLSNLAGLLKLERNFTGAKALFERALRIFQGSLGDDHPDTRRVENSLRSLEQHLRNAE
ncbi:MAG TPA: FxSxx-COOH system tetratricopeptide repeat protein [Blastocatellia bacterium]|nr:FxSxx-COOH system tetratricopeptide repeat protein [Blastocatellia bacterium]